MSPMTWVGGAAILAASMGGIALGAGTLPAAQSNAGDSISQGFDADSLPFDHPQFSWVQGTSSSVNSLFSRYSALTPGFTQQPESVTGAEMIGGSDNFAAQASRICAQSPRPQHVTVLLGANDVCNRPSNPGGDPTANLYSNATWTGGIDAGFDQLAACLPAGSTVQVLSMPRVDFVYNAGYAKGWWCYDVIWPAAGVCRIVTAEGDATRREAIGMAVNAYNDSLSGEVTRYQSNAGGVNPRGIAFVGDWQGSIEQGQTNTSVGTVEFSAGDINDTDCFHPNEGGQAKLACAAWASDPDGSGSVATCLQ